MRIEEITDERSLDELKDEWQALIDGAPDPTPFQTWEWISIWWKHHGRGRLWILACRDGGELVALLPLTISRYRGTPLRQVRFAGAPLADVQQILALPGFEERAAERLMRHLGERRDRWDLCDLNDQPKGAALTRLPPPDGIRVALEPHRTCPWLALPPSYQELLAKLGHHMRSNLKRVKKRVAAFERVEIVDPGAATLAPMMEELFRLHNARWRRRGALGAFTGQRMQRFHHELARRFLERGWLRLYLLRLDGTARGALYAFHYRRRVYHYLGGIDPAARRHSPGIVLLAHAVERAIGDGAAEFDMLRGDEPYKYHWKPAERETQRLILAHASARSRLLRALHDFERDVERRGIALRNRLWYGASLRERIEHRARDLHRRLFGA